MGRAVDFVRSTALRKGVKGTSGTWLGVWVGITLARWLRERLLRDEVVVERYVLRPGEAIEVRDTSIPWRDAPKSWKK